MRVLDLQPCATAMGGLPHVDPEAAVDLVLSTHGDLPAAPRLPGRDRREGRIAQAASGLGGVTVDDNGHISIDLNALDGNAVADAGFPADTWGGLLTFLDRVAGSARSVKLQLTGPLTLALGLITVGAEPDHAFAVSLDALRARATALAALVDEKAPDLAALVFLDEPGLASWSPFDFPLDYGDVVDLLSSALAAIPAPFRTGLHCCRPTDWSLLFAAGPDVVSIPMDVGVEAHPAALGSFLDAGGWVAWGAVPVDRPVGNDPAVLFRRLSGVWCELAGGGCEPELLRCQALVTPACGLQRHDETQASVVLGLATTLAEKVQDQAVGARLALGA